MQMLTSDCDCHLQPENGRRDKHQRLGLALLLIVAAALLEVSVGFFSGSLSLVAEAGHMASDAGAIALALTASWLARFAKTPEAIANHRRLEVGAALINGMGLLAVAGWIGWEAIAHLAEPPDEILGLPMVLTALVGLGINGLNASLLHAHSHHDLNVRGAFLHMLADIISSIGVLVAAIAVFVWQWVWADSAISLAVAIAIGGSAIPFVRQSIGMLLQPMPNPESRGEGQDGLEQATAEPDPELIRAHLETWPQVQQISGLKLWAIAPGQRILAAQVQVEPLNEAAREQLRQEMGRSLQETFHLQDCILQLSEDSLPHVLGLSRPASLMSLVTPPPASRP